MQMIVRYYVKYFIHTYHRTGTLWEGRYKASLIDSDTYALICYRYIELNPVRADMCEHPSDYPWSSYRFNALGQPNDIVVPHDLYKALGRNAAGRQKAYRALFKARVAERTLEEIRDATNKAWVLGSDYFKDKIAPELNRSVRPNQRGGDRKSEAYREKKMLKK